MQWTVCAIIYAIISFNLIMIICLYCCLQTQLFPAGDILQAKIDYCQGPQEEDPDDLCPTNNRPQDWVQHRIQQLDTYEPLPQ